jgi:hypothetical protein
VPNWSHSKKQVRKALDEAHKAGFDVKETTAGHRWGLCPLYGMRADVLGVVYAEEC